MLLRFEVGNHRSIHEPVELSMIAVDKDREAARQLDGFDEKVLTVAAVYGANGSGKTNLIDGLAWMRHAVAVSLRSWEDAIPSDPFSFASDPSACSTFAADIVAEGVRYRYELELNRSEVAFEALYSYPHKRQRALFEREGADARFRRGTRFTGGGRELITPTTLVMSVAKRLTDEIERVARCLRGIRFVNVWPRAFMPRHLPIHRRHSGWVRSDWDDYLLEVFDEQPAADQRENSNPDASAYHGGESDHHNGASDTQDRPSVYQQRRRSLALAMLKFADFGVDGAEVADDALADGTSPRRLRLLHDVAGDSLPLELGQESDGTLTWLGLIPDLMEVLQNGGTLVVDELDASLHPVISGNLIEMFQNPQTNHNNAQIIFTTHDTSLLDCLNRDEVWLTSKRPDGSTELTPLSDFRSNRVRRSTNLERGYLQGRFGGVPIVDQYTVRDTLHPAHTGSPAAAA